MAQNIQGQFAPMLQAAYGGYGQPSGQYGGGGIGGPLIQRPMRTPDPSRVAAAQDRFAADEAAKYDRVRGRMLEQFDGVPVLGATDFLDQFGEYLA